MGFSRVQIGRGDAFSEKIPRKADCKGAEPLPEFPDRGQNRSLPRRRPPKQLNALQKSAASDQNEALRGARSSVSAAKSTIGKRSKKQKEGQAAEHAQIQRRADKRCAARNPNRPTPEKIPPRSGRGLQKQPGERLQERCLQQSF